MCLFLCRALSRHQVWKAFLRLEENQELSATSQDNIDATEKQTDKIVNEWKATSKQVEGLKLYNEQKEFR